MQGEGCQWSSLLPGEDSLPENKTTNTERWREGNSDQMSQFSQDRGISQDEEPSVCQTNQNGWSP